MQRLPLQHHRHRLPAIPPNIKPLSQTWSFESTRWDMGMGKSPKEWLNFLQSNGLNSQLKIEHLKRNSALFKEMFKLKGERFEWQSCWDPEIRGARLTLTVHRPRARLSPKLVATFPWKLRRFIQAATQPQ